MRHAKIVQLKYGTVHLRLSNSLLVYSNSRLSELLKLATAHEQLFNCKMAAIIFVGVFTMAVLWLTRHPYEIAGFPTAIKYDIKALTTCVDLRTYVCHPNWGGCTTPNAAKKKG